MKERAENDAVYDTRKAVPRHQEEYPDNNADIVEEGARRKDEEPVERLRHCAEKIRNAEKERGEQKDAGKGDEFFLGFRRKTRHNKRRKAGHEEECRGTSNGHQKDKGAENGVDKTCHTLFIFPVHPFQKERDEDGHCNERCK